jgi:hypothetical protein
MTRSSSGLGEEAEGCGGVKPVIVWPTAQRAPPVVPPARSTPMLPSNAPLTVSKASAAASATGGAIAPAASIVEAT